MNIGLRLIIGLLAVFPYLVPLALSKKDPFCNDDPPPGSLLTRFFQREVIVPWPATTQAKRVDEWWKQDGKFPNSSLAIRNDGKGLVNDTTGEPVDVARRWEFTCRTPHVVCGQ